MFKYSINLFWSDDDECYIATIQEFPGLSAFGETPEEAMHEAKVAAEMFIKDMVESGDPVPDPIKHNTFSGQFRLRLPKSLHQKLSFQAERDGVSLNTFAISLLSEAVGQRKAVKEISKMWAFFSKTIQIVATSSASRNINLTSKEQEEPLYFRSGSTEKVLH